MGRRGHEILLTMRDTIEIALWVTIIIRFITKGH